MIGCEDNAEDDASDFVNCRRHAIDATAMRTIAIVLYPTSMVHGAWRFRWR